ncbi:MAG: RimK family alpha-L-glutamate ligase [Candidatus Gracilibacteria bacterium]|nr:RimK family alpha-L-glutamate ligase [Candidatus Gracilibacteria bacterium]
MKIGILSFRSLNRQASEEEIELKKQAKARGHIARIFRAAKFQLVYDRESPWFFYNGKPLKKYDVMITRPAVVRDVDLSIALIEQLEMAGIPLFNNYHSILKAKNKIKTTQILDHYGIPLPKTVVIHRPEDVAQAAKMVGGFPVIVKNPFGSFGNGVTIIESMRALNSFLVWDKPLYLLQEYVKYSKGKDMRVFVVNGKVVGSMMRSAKKGEFRSNIELGGIGAPIEPTPEEIAIAIRSVQALDLHYGGVDIMRSKTGPVVLEVNSNPGFKALETATGVSVAGAIVDYAVEFAERHYSYVSQKIEE